MGVFRGVRSLGRDSFELSFNPVYMHNWMIQHPIVPVLALLGYAALIVGGQWYFATRPAWDWRRSMALWNLLLSTFSAMGFLRTAPALLHNLTHYSLRENFCFNPQQHYGSGTTGMWVQLFILSKFPELIDTFFIVVHKKQLILLHWYHHISVLLYCWHSYVTMAPTGLVFCVMNYAVHSIMYFYYFLMAIHCKPTAFQAVYITVAQISQMVVGVVVTLVGCYLLWWDTPRSSSSSSSSSNRPTTPAATAAGKEENCFLTPDNNVAALLMYGSYLALFVQFFCQRYDLKKRIPPHKPKKVMSMKSKGESGNQGLLLLSAVGRRMKEE